MRLSKDDRYELTRGALMADTLEKLRSYIVMVADAVEDLPPGKTEIPCPRYTGPAGNGFVLPVVTPNGGRLFEDARPTP